MVDLEQWLAWRVARLRCELDNWERNREVERVRLREWMLGEQYQSRARMQWFVTVAGVGHGRPEGTTVFDGQPRDFDKINC